MTIWAKRRIHTKICACGCGSTFTTKRSKAMFLNGHSKRLYRGEKSDKWKGGITIDRGYVKIYAPQHPHQHSNYVKRCRLVMEKSINRFLDRSEQVHHLNGDKTDDRLENLIVVSRSEHNYFHKRLPEGKWSTNFDECVVCKKTTTKYKGHGMCRNCYAVARNRQKRIESY